MKVARRRRPELGPQLTLRTSEGDRPAKHGGETLALIEATRVAELASKPCVVQVLDEEDVLYTIEREEDKTVVIWVGNSGGR